jgi:hypothetical protein
MPPESRDDGFCGPSRTASGDYILWWCIRFGDVNRFGPIRCSDFAEFTFYEVGE